MVPGGGVASLPRAARLTHRAAPAPTGRARRGARLPVHSPRASPSPHLWHTSAEVDLRMRCHTYLLCAWVRTSTARTAPLPALPSSGLRAGGLLSSTEHAFYFVSWCDQAYRASSRLPFPPPPSYSAQTPGWLEPPPGRQAGGQKMGGGGRWAGVATRSLAQATHTHTAHPGTAARAHHAIDR